MGVTDVAVGNVTPLYLAVILALRAYGFISGQALGGFFVAVLSSAVVGLILVAALAWDVTRKTSKFVPHVREVHTCRGGICWHGVAVRSPASQVRFRLPLPQNL